MPLIRSFLFLGNIGCGLHIDQALAGLKDEEICKCKESKQKAEDIPDLIKLV